MHFRFEAIKKAPNNGNFVMTADNVLSEVGEARSDLMEEAATPEKPVNRKTTQFYTPAPGMRKNFY